MNIPQSYRELNTALSALYEQVDGQSFYEYIFPSNEKQGEQHSDFSKPNAIYLYRDERDRGTERTLRRRIMLSDTWVEDFYTYVEGNEMTLCSGLSYRSRSNKLQHAQQMNALVFDLDGVGDSEIRNLFLRFGKPPAYRTLPTPTFLVCSGTGLHIYYVFDKPIDLYPNIKLQLKALKYDLTFRIWDYKGTSTCQQIQYQSINQGFRMVGSVNNKYGVPVVAYQTGDRVTLDYLNQYVNHEENKVDINRPFRPSKMTRAEAKEAYPEWYERVVVKKQHQPKKWDIAGKVHGQDSYALYHWWLRQIGSIRGGHRYFYMMCLVIYACKCDVPRAKLEADLQIAFEQLKTIDHTNALTEQDIESALETFDKEYYNFTIADIEKLTDVRIERNKRNFRNRAIHVKYMNNQRAFKVEMGECTNGGRPKGSGEKKAIVEEWQRQHPTGTKAECHRDTGLDPKTIRKWWKLGE